MSGVPRKPTQATFWAVAVGTPAFLVATFFETLGPWGSVAVVGLAVGAALFLWRRERSEERDP